MNSIARRRILGIDPGLVKTGWGVIEVSGNQLSFKAAGTIATPTTLSLPARLHALSAALAGVIEAQKPGESAVEETFMNKSGASTLKLGQARGAILLTLAQSDLSVSEYSANLIKKTVTGSGHGEKTQVARMVQMLLPGCTTHGADAMDALAVAICHSQHHRFSG